MYPLSGQGLGRRVSGACPYVELSLKCLHDFECAPSFLGDNPSVSVPVALVGAILAVSFVALCFPLFLFLPLLFPSLDLARHSPEMCFVAARKAQVS